MQYVQDLGNYYCKTAKGKILHTLLSIVTESYAFALFLQNIMGLKPFQIHIPIIQLFIIIGSLKYFPLQSCAYKFGYSLFQDSEETIHSAGINATSYKPPWFLAYRKTKKKIFLINPITKNQKPKN